MDSPAAAEFAALLDPINELAEESPGFVWRLRRLSDPLRTERARPDNDRQMIINFSVWESREALWNFVYKSGHLAVLRRRREWFGRMADAYLVLWWVPARSIPTVAEGMERLEILREDGPGPEAFTFDQFYASDGQLTR